MIPLERIGAILWTALRRMLRQTSETNEVRQPERASSYGTFPVLVRTLKGDSVVRFFVFT